MTRHSFWCIFLVLEFSTVSAQTPDYILKGVNFRRSTLSNIRIVVFNDGAILSNFRIPSATSSWFGDYEYAIADGFGHTYFGCKKQGRILITNGWNFRVPSLTFPATWFTQFVPGAIGDPNAAPDTSFSGIGWKFLNDINYIVYVSIDYDSKGIDKSGNNFPDWPIRNIEGKEIYVQDISQRNKYPPIYRSDEDMFCVFKDTETGADPEFQGKDADPQIWSIPIGLEVRLYCYSWAKGILKDVLISRYEIINKSGVVLDSCFVGVNKGFIYLGRQLHNYAVICDNESRNNNLAYTYLEESIPNITDRKSVV